MVYTHVLNRGGRGVHSPLDRLVKAVSATERGGIIRNKRNRIFTNLNPIYQPQSEEYHA